MKILLTGASSFTGAWFARALADAGHQVTATFRRPAAAYAGLEGERLALLAGRVRPVHGVAFGDPGFVALAGSGFDLVCHHGAHVDGYRDPQFDVAAALAANTRGTSEVLRAMTASGCHKLLVTGTVFESGEGQGDAKLRAFGGYGLSKAFTWQLLAHECDAAGVDVGKFVVPNPFGPYEQERFTAYLMRRWAAGETAEVMTPGYVRDHVHISLLAAAYAGFAERLARSSGVVRLGPSGYRESVGGFARRVADELGTRTGLACRLRLADQTAFPEPRVRVNTDRVEVAGWDEEAAWDALAEWYMARLRPAAAA
ncbi:MAG: NAD-dependent epimerase/dehydratase family protein [Gaiellales bacterium]